MPTLTAQIPDEDLEAAGFEDACAISNNAQEHHEWLEEAVHEMQGLMKEGLPTSSCGGRWLAW